MAQFRSIHFRLTLALFLVFVLVIGLGAFSLWRLSNYQAAAADIRDRFLPNTQYIGDLNNFTSDFRAAEGTALVVEGEAAIRANQAEIEQLDRLITLSQHAYEHIANDAAEIALYRGFADKWRAYREIADQVLTLAVARRSAAVQLYLAESHRAYAAASDALDTMTERNRQSARDASLRADAAYRQARWLTLAGGLLAAGIMLGGWVYIKRSTLSPLRDLSRVMHRLAINDLDVVVKESPLGDEIGEMARAVEIFRRNAVELAVNQRALAEQASLLGEKLAHERRLTELQRNFVSMASHEFRTPLTVIDGHAQRLMSRLGRSETEEIVERAGKIRSAVARMTGTIANLLESARLIENDAGLYIHPGEFDLAQLLHDVCQLYREVAPRADIVEVIRQRPLIMTGDQKLLFQVFSNIVSNAVKYSPDGGTIRVTAEAQGERMRIMVADRGVGILPQDLDRLFERYFRGGNVSGIVGTGIGLYLVKTVVDLHGGSVAVESRERMGTTFTVVLPILFPGARAAPGDLDHAT